MNLGIFSLSLAVKDIEASRIFYEKLGFTQFAGVQEQGWLVIKQGDTILGLFQGMIEQNILTFNPGWDGNGQEVNPFDDIRSIQEDLRLKGIRFISEVAADTEGRGSFVVVDPDGNQILVDQHR